MNASAQSSSSDASISIVIPHHGDPAPTLSLIDALPVPSLELQVIVVDDASPQVFPEAKGADVVRREVNGGFGAAVNTGVAQASHRLLLILNSDLEIGPTFVSDLLARAQPWLPAVVSPRVVGHDGQDVWTGRHFPTVRQQTTEWLTPLARWRDRRILHEAVGHDTRVGDDDVVVDWVVGAAMLVPTVDFLAVGGFDERFFMNAEEVDLQRRLRARGLPAVALGGPTVVHEGGGSSDPARRRRWLVDSRLAYAEKWGGRTGRRRLQAALVGATAVNLAFNAGRRLAGRSAQPVTTARSEFALIFDRLHQ